MWSKTYSETIPDSDQSISEDEDAAIDSFHGGLGASEAVKDGLRLQSQLDELIGFSSEEEVELPVFHNERKFVSSPAIGATCDLNEDILSDDEGYKLHLTSEAPHIQKTRINIHGREIEEGTCTWSEVTKEAAALANEIEKTRPCLLHEGPSRVNKLSKGVPSRGNSKLLFRFQSRKGIAPSSIGEADLSSKVLCLPEEDISTRNKNKSMSEILGNFEGEKIERLDTCGLAPEAERPQKHTMNSVSEILDSYRVIDGRKFPWSDEKALDLDRDDIPETLDSGSPSDHEANDRNSGLARPEIKQKTMADKFQDAFATTSVYDEAPRFALHGFGIFEKLQKVMHIEKNQERNFLKHVETGACSEGVERFMDVEILSRCLEAKLTVCCCTLSRSKESSPLAERLDMWKENRKTMTIIFNSRVCEDVELEVGNVIRIFSPWKETQVTGKEEVIILASYFFHISSS